MLVHPALVDRLKARQNAPRKSSSSKPRLWASEVGGCLRKAMLRITGHQPTIVFSLKALESMQNGVVYEKDTQDALAAAYAADFTSQLWLGNDIWSCYSDFVLFHRKPEATIIEHKAVGDKWWNYNGELPKEAHVIQLALYKYLYQTMFGIDPAVILFYRSWGHYAELLIEPKDDHVVVAGKMDDAPVSKILLINFERLRQEAEAAYASGEIPPAFERPLDGQCTFQGVPSCPMYGHCWSK